MHNNQLKPLITLSQINSLPQGHLHSKVSFLKAIINEQQNPQIFQMKQKMYQISYTIKNIGIHGEQIGITSKRLPLKGKQQYKPVQINQQKLKEVFKRKYLPQNSFYSQPLIPIKKTKCNTEEHEASNNIFLINSQTFRNNEFSTHSQTKFLKTATKFSKKIDQPHKFIRNSSHSSNIKHKNKQYSMSQKQKQFIQKITNLKRGASQPKINAPKTKLNRKSFSKLLNQCQSQKMIKKRVEICPLQHQQNSLFKKFQRLSKLTDQKNKNPQISNRERPIILSRNSQTFQGRYHGIATTARIIQSRNLLSRDKHK